MAGTKIGGMKAKITNYKKHGKDFYKKIGSKGGKTKTSKPKGFAANPELAKIAGKKGGKISRRGPVKSTAPKKTHQTLKIDHKVEKNNEKETKKSNFVLNMFGRKPKNAKNK